MSAALSSGALFLRSTSSATVARNRPALLSARRSHVAFRASTGALIEASLGSAGPSPWCSNSSRPELGFTPAPPRPEKFLKAPEWESPENVQLVQASAAAAADGASEEAGDKADGLVKTLQLGSLFGMWYLFNIYFNIYNKQVLKVFPNPITLTTIQFAVGAVIVQLMWLSGIYKRPKLDKATLLSILPLAAVHTMGNAFTNMSLGKVAVSFTHTIKAMEPFFSVVLSAIVLGDKPTLPVILALTPIVGGVALASATEASFNWAGFLSAMASNLTFQSRNVLSKKLMIKKDESLDNINLFAVITTMSFFLLVPIMLLTEGVRFLPSQLAAQGLDVNQLAFRALMTGICFHAYQQVSYMILQQVSPVTHSVGNCVKRVIVIVTSVLFFRTPVSTLNAVGTGIALAGVFGYSRVKAAKPKKA